MADSGAQKLTSWATVFMGVATPVLSLYFAWRSWVWLGPTSWLFGSGFAWFVVKVVLTLLLVGGMVPMAVYACAYLVLGAAAMVGSLGRK